MMTLTADKIKKAGTGRHGDGHGLYLVVTPAGSRQWVQRITLPGGPRVDRGLGGFPTVTLSQARKVADANRVAVKQGRNPFGAAKAEEPQEVQETTTPTFRDMAEREYNRRFGNEGQTPTARRWWSRLEIHVFPEFGDRAVTEVARVDVAKIVDGLREEHFETARKVKQEMSGVFLLSVAHGYQRADVADKATDRLIKAVKPNVQNRPALEHSQVARAVQKIKNGEGKRATKLCFEFLILTATRSAEARGATWAEMDLSAATWTIPAGRMKARRDHVIPLSTRCMEILSEARNLWIADDDDDSDIGWGPEIPADGLVFPHPHSGKRLSENSLSDRAKKDKLGCVPHGFRSSFRDYAAESGAYTWEAIELSLAHAIGTSVQAAYFRTNLLDQRRPLMQAWSDYVSPSAAPF